MQKNLPRSVLMTITKAFVRPDLDYGDVSYDEVSSETWICSALSRAIRRLSGETLYQEIGLEFLYRCRCYKNFCLFYQIFKENKLVYLINLIATKYLNYNARNTDRSTLFHTKLNLTFIVI